MNSRHNRRPLRDMDKDIESFLRNKMQERIRYRVPPCPGCGLCLEAEFGHFLEGKGSLPGDDGHFACPHCGAEIRYVLQSFAVVDVLPLSPKSG